MGPQRGVAPPSLPVSPKYSGGGGSPLTLAVLLADSDPVGGESGRVGAPERSDFGPPRVEEMRTEPGYDPEGATSDG